MAKWGEGDPRWIVEDREDGVNVNNWHWIEKDCSAWSKNWMNDVMIGLKCDGADGSTAEVVEVSKMTGDATANNRKGKLILFYEWVLELKWKGSTADGSSLYGTIECNNLSDENDIDDLDLVSRPKKDTSEGRVVNGVVKEKLLPHILEILGNYRKTLLQDFCGDLVKGKSKGESPSPAHSPHPTVSSGESKVGVLTSRAPSAPTKAEDDATITVSISDKRNFVAPQEELFKTFLEVDRVRAFTMCDAKVDSKIGGFFELFGGQVTGKFIEIVPHKKIVQSWRFKSWPSQHYSTVTITLVEKNGETQLSLVQTGVPKADAERVRSGWTTKYWNGMFSTFGWGGKYI